MQLLSHRGLWNDPAEKNTIPAFERSLTAGFGIETDVRDALGELVLSHDLPTGGEPTLAWLLSAMSGSALPLAINIKADGMASKVADLLSEFPNPDAFVFDMSIPETRPYLTAGLPVFLRRSEVEGEHAWSTSAAGIWLDSFQSTWFDAATVRQLVAQHERVCVVSGELHGRDATESWEALVAAGDLPGLMLCTDHPLEAAEHFGRSHD